MFLLSHTLLSVQFCEFVFCNGLCRFVMELETLVMMCVVVGAAVYVGGQAVRKVQ